MNKNALGLLLAVLSTGLPLRAQDESLHSKVEVERPYEAQLPAIDKPGQEISLPDSLRHFSTLVNYRIFEKPYRDVYDFTRIPALNIVHDDFEPVPFFYAHAALGYPLNPRACVALQKPFDNGLRIGASAIHRSFWGKAPMVDPSDGAPIVIPNDVSAYRMFNKGSFHVSYPFGKSSIYAGASYEQSYHAYYGYNPFILVQEPVFVTFEDYINAGFFNDNLSHRFQKAAFILGVRHIDSLPRSWQYSARISYSYANDRTRIFYNRLNPTEKLIDLDASLDYKLRSDMQIGARLAARALNNPLASDLNRGIAEIAPFFRWDLKRFVFNAGFRTGATFDGDFYAYGRIDMNMDLVPGRLAAFLMLDGKTDLDTYQELIEENPWLNPDVDSLRAPRAIEARIGANANFLDCLDCSLYGAYRHTDDQHYFLSDGYYPNLFDIGYADEERFSLGGILSWHGPALDVSLRAVWHHYKLSTGLPAWHKPRVEARLHAGYRFFRERFSINIDGYYRGKAYAPFNYSRHLLEEGSSDSRALIRDFVNLDLSLSYRINRHMDVFVQGKNLLNNEQQYYLLYREPGLVVGGGMDICF